MIEAHFEMVRGRVARSLPAIAATIQQWYMKHQDFLPQVVLVLLAGLLRFWRIEQPDALVFDEVYFSVFANNYLEGVHFFDSHPPLGKYLIAIGIRFFGFIPLGYRVINALFGVGVVILIYRLGTLLFEDRRVGFWAGMFAALDGILLVESRAGLINIFAVFFSLGAYYLFLRSGGEKLEKPHWLYLAGAGVCIGSAVAVKWIGVAGFGVIFGVYFAAKASRHWKWAIRLLPQNQTMQRLGKIHPDLFLLCLGLVPAMVYAASFIIHLNQIDEFHFFELQRQIYGYHAHLQAGHGYASPWWSWPLLMRPVSYFWQHDQSTQTVTTILNLGNPALWWLAIPAVFSGLWLALFRRHFGASFAILAIACHYLPFSLISRASFIYHFMGALPFTILLLAFSLVQLWQANGWRRELAALAIFAILLCAIYFYPIWTGLPIPTGAFYQRMWLFSWI